MAIAVGAARLDDDLTAARIARSDLAAAGIAVPMAVAVMATVAEEAAVATAMSAAMVGTTGGLALTDARFFDDALLDNHALILARGLVAVAPMVTMPTSGLGGSHAEQADRSHCGEHHKGNTNGPVHSEIS